MTTIEATKKAITNLTTTPVLIWTTAAPNRFGVLYGHGSTNTANLLIKAVARGATAPAITTANRDFELSPGQTLENDNGLHDASKDIYWCMVSGTGTGGTMAQEKLAQ